MRVSRAKLADILGRTEQTLNNWLDEGMPVISTGSRGVEGEYDTAAVIRWLIARETGSRDDDGNVIVYEAERARLTKEQADKVAMDNDLKRGVIVDANKVAAHWGKLITNAKTRLLAIPTKAAPLVVGSKNLNQPRDVIERMISEVLNDLASANPLPDSSGDTAGVESTTATDGEPVGRPASQVKPRKQRRARAMGD